MMPKDIAIEDVLIQKESEGELVVSVRVRGEDVEIFREAVVPENIISHAITALGIRTRMKKPENPFKPRPPEECARWATMKDVVHLGVKEISEQEWVAQLLLSGSVTPFPRIGDITSDRLGQCLAVYFKDVDQMAETIADVTCITRQSVFMCVPNSPCNHSKNLGDKKFPIVALICLRLGELED